METNAIDIFPSYVRFGRQLANGLTVACFPIFLAKAGIGWWHVVFDQEDTAGLTVGVFVDTISAAAWSYVAFMMIFRWNSGGQVMRRLIQACFILLISLGITTRADNLLGLDMPTAWRNPSVIGVTCLLVIIFWLMWPIRGKPHA